MTNVKYLMVVALFGTSVPLHAQGTKADYERATSLQNRVRNKLTNEYLNIIWIEDGSRFCYARQIADGKREYVLVDAEKAMRGPAFDHAKLASALTAQLKSPLAADAMPLAELQFFNQCGEITFRCKEKYWRYVLASDTLTEAPKPTEKPQVYRRGADTVPTSPDGQWTAKIQDHNVWLTPKSGPAVRLSTDGIDRHAYHRECYWSPDSKFLVVMKVRQGDDRKVSLIESSPKDQLQPKLHTMQYLKPGDVLTTRKPVLFEIATKKKIEVSDALFPNPWNIDHVRWTPDSKQFTFRYNQRGHTVLRLISVSTGGEAKILIDEPCKTFIDYAHKAYFQYLEKTNQVLWMSERSGWSHLYRFDLATGKLVNPVTTGNWVVRTVDRVDETTGDVYLQAGGYYPEQNPYYLQALRVSLDGAKVTKLTTSDATHEIRYAPNGKFFVDSASRVDLPPVHTLRRSADGSQVLELERPDWAELLKTGWRPPERFVAKGRDGVTDIYGVLHRPTNFDTNKRYPVIESIYAGPHAAFVPTKFQSFYHQQKIAELGFIVVQIDGMGTSLRSKAFHDVCWKNLGDSGFPDRILWIKSAAQKYPQMDLTRVGIYGGSAGGQSALRALLAHGDFYKAAVADCGCHDNRMDKVWWNELWMGWPIGPHYEEQSNVTQAHKLKGDLLLIVGEMDRNVDPASTMQVVNALIKADRDFELLVVPGGGHGIAESPYGQRRRMDFFVRKLLGVMPRS